MGKKDLEINLCFFGNSIIVNSIFIFFNEDVL
jgi:hypothetical protein